jgi:hypothetical protein
MKQSLQDLISDLPGTALIQQVSQDYQANRHTMPSSLVRMARRRLVKAGLLDSAVPQHDINAELELYQLLSHEGNQAHSRYNALIRELISFEHALDHRLGKV